MGRRLQVVAAGAWLVACGGDERHDPPAGAESGIGVTATSGISDADGGLKLDVAGDTEGKDSADDGGTAQGCQRIDFLFVIDNSGSMRDEQQNLVASFPDFIDSMRAVTEVDDFRVMVVDTDGCDPSFGVGEGGECDETTEPGCCQKGCATWPAGTCNGMQCSCPDTGDACTDVVLGAGRITDKNGAPCGIEGGRRYMLDDQSNLHDTFACVAEVGILGSGDERTMDTLLAAIDDETTAGGCNEGFVRDDALLVVVIITDEEDDHEASGFGSMGEPTAWYDAVVQRKNGSEKHVVVLSLVGPPPPDACPPLAANAVDGAQLAERLQQFTELFTFGFVGPVCSPSYKDFFDAAVGVVDEACSDFIPPG